MEAIICRNCGANVGFERDGDLIKCRYCQTTFHAEREQKVVEKLRSMLDEEGQKLLFSAKRRLYDLLTSDEFRRDSVVEAAETVKRHSVDDFVANYYLCFYTGSANDLVKFLGKIDVRDNTVIPFIERTVTHLIDNLTKELMLPVADLIERAAKANVYSVERQGQFREKLEEMSRNLDGCVYDPRVERDIFIMHSGKDIEKVMNLVSILEDNGLECFVSQRNIRHGRDATQEYTSILETAMEHCRWVLFVSSRNSRDRNCQAVSFELDYIKTQDVNNAPPEYRYVSYGEIPNRYKKPRIEYLIEHYDGSNKYGERAVQDFFSRLEYVADDPAAVLKRFKKGWLDSSTGGPGGPGTPTPGDDEKEGDWGDVASDIKEILDSAAYFFKQKQYEDAFRDFSEAADMGNATAICNLGYMYEAGLGVDRDVYKAAKLYREAADKGNARAKYNLGVCYKLGIGIVCNESMAAQLIGEAAEQGDSYAKMKVNGA